MLYHSLKDDSPDSGTPKWLQLNADCHALGFSIRRARTKIMNKARNIIDYRTLACSKSR